MTKPTASILTLLFFTAFLTLPCFSAQSDSSGKESQLYNDLSKVWPFSQTVKVEYELVLAQLEMMENDSLKKDYLANYEEYVKDAYFDRLVRLNIRQGKLLLLLIDRELGKTPYELLRNFRDKERADFWQKFAKFLGADLKGKYDPKVYPEIEEIVLKLSEAAAHQFITPKLK
jgi:hypothetical protein